MSGPIGDDIIVLTTPDAEPALDAGLSRRQRGAGSTIAPPRAGLSGRSTLPFELVEDTPSLTTNDGREKRWVVVQPPGATLAAYRRYPPRQRKRVRPCSSGSQLARPGPSPV